MRAQPNPAISYTELGQAAVETALVMPLALFLVLGSLQLFMLLQARLLAQYAAARSTRAGSLTSGECLAMTHTAIAALLPAIAPLTGSAPAAAMGAGFGARRANRYVPALDGGRDEHIVWLIREGPAVPSLPEEEFDLPFAPGGRALDLELRLVFWCPLKIPFANWVFTRMALSHYGLEQVRGYNPFAPTRPADWEAKASLATDIGAELRYRARRGHYAFPIQTTYVMRMMTPPRLKNLSPRACDPDAKEYAQP